MSEPPTKSTSRARSPRAVRKVIDENGEEKEVEERPWGEPEQDAHVRNLYKAEKLMGDVLYRLNLFMLSAQHYAYLNSAIFTTPSIIITSIASFLSFMAATDPARSKEISLSVGFLGTLATIVTALQSSYKYDTMAETFRAAAAEYRLLNTRINSMMRKERVYPEEWEKLWDEIESRMTEMQKKMSYFPNRDLVDNWARAGKLSEKTMSGSMMPPWLIRYQQDLEDDGIQQEEDIKYITDELFEYWEQPLFMPDPEDDEKSIFDPEQGYNTRYPKVVMLKLKEKRDHYVKMSSKKKISSNIEINMNGTTMAALRKRGIYTMSDFRLASDEVMDSIIDELIVMDTPPMPIAWAALEETVAHNKAHGILTPFYKLLSSERPSEKAQARIDRVNETNHAIAQQDAARLNRANRASRTSGSLGRQRSGSFSSSPKSGTK